MPTAMRLVAFALVLLVAAPALGARGVVIQDFESGSVTLDSYPDQDSDPGDWSLVTNDTYEGSYALRLYGNTWKQQSIAPYAVDPGTVWQVAVRVDQIGEMQGFGVGDGTNELLYSFAGEQLPEGEQWWTVYQGAHYHSDEWELYLLPIGEDWQATYGALPTLDRLFYINDNDDGGQAVVLFDAVIDVTDDLPVAPTVDASYTTTRQERVARGLYRLTLQFHSQVDDPDSATHDYLWDFGDGATSTATDPTHEFLVQANYPYAVGLTVTDPDGYTGGDTCQVAVEVGEGGGPVTVNFVGDIMIGRAYENNGGIIDSYGVDAIFDPTKPIFGDAADLSCANLEVPFTDQGSGHPTKSVVFRAEPQNFAGVANAGIELCDLGNNHIVDYGEVGMLQTQSLCDDAGILHFGSGRDDREALAPAFVTERGIRMAFLGLSNRTGRRWNYQPFLDAGASKPGFAYLIPKNLEESIDAVRDLADIVIVQTHSGNEYETQGAPNEGEPGGAKSVTLPTEPMPVEAVEIGPDTPNFKFRNEPTPTERELRRLALDEGADILINHHPHVLQGFETHDGKLIVHCLGNFIFDLYYPETMPTIVFTLEIEKTGITGYRFVPAWIDDYITQPATGMLGREIMDMLADYSRDMGAIVATNVYTGEARVFLSPGEAPTWVDAYQATVPLRDEGGQQLSRPHEVTGPGSLSRIVNVSGDGLAGYEVRVGREILWHGNFEDEGATFWDDNTSDEWLDDSEAWRGQRSLALRRSFGQSSHVGTDLEKHLACDPTKEHSFLGWTKTVDATGVNILARFYPDRYAGSPVSSTPIGDDLTGTHEWFQQWAELETPENGDWFELRCNLSAPAAADESRAWFDELKFIEWEPWQPGADGLDVPHPNNYRFVQIRSAEGGVSEVTLTYEETAYAQDLTALPESAPAVKGRLAQNYPNPFNPSTRIELAIPADGPDRVDTELSIFDVRGRRLVTLFSGDLAGGERRVFDWDGRDGSGRELPSGVYFSRARFGTRAESRKMILLR